MHSSTLRKIRDSHAFASHFRMDLSASIVVFLVALPLCVGVAAASGVPAELGLITGIVGGLVTGLLPGSKLQVSGPAAGLTVITWELVHERGVGVLGVVVLGAGILQIAFGLLRFGRWFQAISSGVVAGMLAGIGAVLILSQLYAALDLSGKGKALNNLAGIPGLLSHAQSALAPATVAVVTLLVVVAWPRIPAVSRWLPAPLVAVLVSAGAAALLALPVRRLDVGSVLGSVRLSPSIGVDGFLDGALIASMVIFALIASAESLFTANAVDRMHTGSRTRYDSELVAQGVGNTVCGLLGALPMTAVIVRSSANIAAGARTRASRVLHGVWLLVFVLAMPWVLAMIPVATLAALLLHAGWKLVSPATVLAIWREHRGEALVLVTTATAIVATSLFEGVVIGVLAAVVKTVWELSRLTVSVETTSDAVRIDLLGHATFLTVPRLAHVLESIPPALPVHIDAASLGHYDHSCQQKVAEWTARQISTGRQVLVVAPGGRHAPVGQPA